MSNETLCYDCGNQFHRTDMKIFALKFGEITICKQCHELRMLMVDIYKKMDNWTA